TNIGSIEPHDIFFPLFEPQQPLRHCRMSAMADLVDLPLPHPHRPPTAEEVRFSKARIESLGQEIDDLELKITKFRDRGWIQDLQQQLDQGAAAGTLDSKIEKIQAEVHELERKRANYISYVSPIRRLPTEILSQIIDLCLKDREDITKLAAICGRFRDVTLGMTRIWSNISLQSNYHVEEYMRVIKLPVGNYGYSMFTVEQLELVLERAGSAQLKIHIEWPVESGALKLISMRNHPIWSLKVRASPTRKAPFVTEQFMKLNVQPLTNLVISNIDWKDAKGLMDLALQSSSKKFTLSLHNVVPTFDLFRHRFMDH
ncbi:1597_t:CDS:2, partial [Acaulospora colombiana]